MRVFVTGGNGFLGSSTVKELRRKGYKVRCLLRKESAIERIQRCKFETHIGDIRDLESLREGMQGCDAVIHLACISSWQQIRENEEQLDSIVVGGTENVLRAAKANGNLRTVHVSSSAAINASKKPFIFDETSPYTLQSSTLKYSLAKHKAEEIVTNYVINLGSDALMVNPCEVYGPNDTGMVTAGNILEILKNGAPIACAGGTAIAHVDDVARGIVLALEKGRTGERYILGGENLTITELTQLVRRFAGKSDHVITLPNSVLLPFSYLMRILRLPPPIPADVLSYATLYWFMDSTKAKRELGYSWRSANQTIQIVFQWLLKTKRFA